MAFRPVDDNTLKGEGPLASLEGKGDYDFSGFVYPDTLGTKELNHFVVFHINESDNTQQEFAAKRIVDNDTSQVNQGGFQAPRPTRRVATSIALYMPPQIQTDYAVQWESYEAGLIGAAIQQGRNIDFSSRDKVISSISDFVSSFKGDVSYRAFHNLLSGVETFTDLAVEKSIFSRFRKETNPHKEIIFDQIDFRTFQFQWRLMPRSESEAEKIYNIVQAFKFYSVPEINTDDKGRYFIYPAEFDIEFFANGKSNRFINRISTCACTNVSVNYTGQGLWAAHREGPAPWLNGVASEVQLTLTFRELEIMTKKRILEGF